jgi:hypothetical protein
MKNVVVLSIRNPERKECKAMSKQIKKITDLTPDPCNANKGTERGAFQLEGSLQKYGAGRSILTDKNGVVIAGNKTLEHAADLGLDIEVVKTTGDKLVVVQREDLDLADGTKARELAYADNRIAENDLDWSVEQIMEDMDAGVDLGQFWRPEELESMVKAIDMPEIMPPDASGECEKCSECGRAL